jgi:SAM-dependent methyltransferase
MCSAPDSTLLFDLTDRLHSTPGRFAYRRCRGCRTVFQDPRVVPEDLALCYPQEYEPYRSPAAAAAAPRSLSGARDALRRTIQAHVRGEALAGPWRLVAPLLSASRRLREQAFYSILDELLPRRGGDRRALDVGCGSGGLMATLARIGWQIDGIEWDAQAAARAARVTGRPVWTGDFREVDLPRGAYDLVLFNHVFEHLAAPRDAIARVAELLRPGGRVVIVSPNPDSFGAHAFGADWFPWEAPRHLVLPTIPALARLAEELGWSAFRARTTARSAAYYLNNSRAYRHARPLEPEPKRRDRLLGSWEGMLVALGRPRGEELVCVLRGPGKAA